MPADRLERVSEFVDRANYGLVNAAFELDRDSGDVRLRTGMELATLPPQYTTDDAFLEALVLDLAAANIGIFDRYVTGLVAVTLGDVPVADIIARDRGRRRRADALVEQRGGGVLDDRRDVGQEPAALLAVDVAVVERQRQRRDVTDGDLVDAVTGDHPRLLADRAEAEDRRLAGVDDRRAGVDAEDARRW